MSNKRIPAFFASKNSTRSWTRFCHISQHSLCKLFHREVKGEKKRAAKGFAGDKIQSWRRESVVGSSQSSLICKFSYVFFLNTYTIYRKKFHVLLSFVRSEFFSLLLPSLLILFDYIFIVNRSFYLLRLCITKTRLLFE